MSNSKKAIVYTLSCVVLWSLIPVVSRFGQTGLDNFQFLFWSSLLSLVVLLVSTVFAGQFKQFLKYSATQVSISLGLGFLGTFLYYVLLYYGYAHAQGLEVLVLQYTWPVLIVLFAWFFLSEKISLRTIIALLIGFVGVATVLTKGDFTNVHLSNMAVDFSVLIGAAAFALFSVLSKKVQYESFTVTTLFFVAATICSFISLMLFSEFAWPSSLLVWSMIFLNGALINGLSYVLWLQALKYGKASRLATLVFFTPVLAAILIVLLFNEPFHLSYIFGLIAVITAGFIAQRTHLEA